MFIVYFKIIIIKMSGRQTTGTRPSKIMSEEAPGTSLRPQLARKHVGKAIEWAPICSVNAATGVAITVWLSPAYPQKIKEPAQHAVYGMVWYGRCL